MKKLKDIRENIPTKIDISAEYVFKNISVEGPLEQDISTQDIRDITTDISLKSSEGYRVEKNKTRFFDSLSAKKLFFPETLDISSRSSWKKIHWPQLPKMRGYMVVIVLIFGVILLSIDKQFVESRVKSGYTRLIDLSKTSGSLSDIKLQVNHARFDFLVSDIFFTPFKVFSGESVNNAYHAIKGGKKLTTSIDSVFEIYGGVLDFLEDKDLGNIHFSHVLLNLRREFVSIEDQLSSTLRHYSSISSTGNRELDTQLQQQIGNLEFLTDRIKNINNNFSTFLDVFGHSKRKTYLVVFQNSDEIRPTGGFMGSMATVSVFRGKLVDFVPRDVYSFEWDLKRAEYQRVAPPKGINILTSSFGLRDANYYINLKDSSEAIKFFVEKSGQDIDGVIYMNQGIVEDLLSVTGPIYFPPLERSIESENFSEIMSLIVEAKIFKQGVQGTPKQILFDFINAFKKELLSQKQYGAYAKILLESFRSRELMVYSFESDENTFLSDLGLGGAINTDDTLDYNYPVFTSLSGNKSDRYMQRSFRKTFSVGESCRIDSSLDIVSRHTFNKQKRENMEALMKEYGIDPTELIDIQGQGDNYQFVRVLLPNDSQIEQQDGMVIRNYGSRKGVEFFLRTRPTETTTYRIDYSLPNPDCQQYSYKHLKQPGIREYDIEVVSENKQDSFTGLQKDFFYADLEDSSL